MTPKAQIESFLFNAQKPKTEWENKANTMTVWEDAHNYDASVCGRYFSYYDLWHDMNEHSHIQFNFGVQIGFDDILCFEAFELFPSCALGQLELVITCSPDALVWCCVDPEVTIPEYLDRGNMNPLDKDATSLTEYLFDKDLGAGTSHYIDLRVASKNLTPFDVDCYYDRRFTQVQQEGRCATNIFKVKGTNDHYSYDFKDITILPHDLKIEEAKSTLSGFNLRTEEVQKLIQHYKTTPMVIPSEHVVSYSFTTPPTEGQLNCVLNLNMVNVKEIEILFPRLSTDLTCFFNPMLRGLQLSFDKKRFPDRGAQTNTGEFLRYSIESANLDGVLQCTEAFENSIVVPPQTKAPFRDRSKNDNSSFQFIVPVERKSANAFFFDGVNNPAETITLTANPIVSEGDQDIYLYNHRHNQPNTGKKNGTPPMICLVSDTFWLFSTSGKKCIYEISKTWNQVFKDNFPQLYGVLLQQAKKQDPLLYNP
jgi:hypothetical protein